MLGPFLSQKKNLFVRSREIQQFDLDISFENRYSHVIADGQSYSWHLKWTIKFFKTLLKNSRGIPQALNVVQVLKNIDWFLNDLIHVSKNEGDIFISILEFKWMLAASNIIDTGEYYQIFTTNLVLNR